MTQAEEILCAIAHIIGSQKQLIFSREDIRQRAKIEKDAWNSSYSPTFQAMRSDHPGGAPPINPRYQNVFRQVSHGKHSLTDYGYNLLKQLKLWQFADSDIPQEVFAPKIIGIHQIAPGDNLQPTEELCTGTIIYFVRVGSNHVLMKPIPSQNLATFDNPKYRLHIDQITGGFSFEPLV